MKKQSLCLFFIFYCFNLYAVPNDKTVNKQNPAIKVIDASIQESKTLASSNPSEAKKQLLELKKKSEKMNHKDGVMKSSMGLLLIYYNDGDYKKAIEESRVVEKYAQELQYIEYISDVYRLRSNAYGEMGLLDESLKELEKAVPFIDKIEDKNRRIYRKALIYESYSGVYDKKGNHEKQLFYRHKSISESKKMSESNPVIQNAKFQNLAYQYASIGLIHSKLSIYDSAEHYFEKALKIHESEKYDIYINGRAVLLSDMAKFYYAVKNYDNAIAFAKKAENFEKQAPMPYIRKDIYHSLFNSYVETEKKDSSKHYLKLYNTLNDSILKYEKETILTPVNQIIYDKEAENKNKILNILIISAVALLFFSMVGWFFWKRKNNIIQKRYEKLIARINQENEEIYVRDGLQEKTESANIKSSVSITDETTKNLLLKLEKFEASDKYLRNDINLTWLANNLNTNTKYLSEIIKIYRNKTFSNYINGLRIDYIIHKLFSDPVYREYKINYLAEVCGYSSRQVFVICFKKETGFTPSFFIENLKKTIV